MEDTVAAPNYVTLAEGTIASDYALKNLNKSLGEAQAEFTPASKGEENKWGGYKYTSLENIIKAVRPSLTKHHLTMSQFSIVDLELKTIRLVTRLVHWDSGEWMQNNLDLPAELALGKDGAPKFNQQTIGGSSTYAQKYAYKTILGIPDSEEMIDSSEEKGDLPARSKAARKQSVDDRVAQASTSTYNQKHDGVKPGNYYETDSTKTAKTQNVYVKNGKPTALELEEWSKLFAECETLDKWNEQVVPLMKEFPRDFVVLAAEQAKLRGYKVDRASSKYIAGGSTPPRYQAAPPQDQDINDSDPTVDEYEQAYEERQAAQ